jgi:hypothetical protein
LQAAKQHAADILETVQTARRRIRYVDRRFAIAVATMAALATGSAEGEIFSSAECVSEGVAKRQ